MSDDKCIRDEPWNILCRVVKQEGNCAAGHKVGDEVLYGKYAGTEFKYEGKDYLIMRESDILAII